MSQFKTTSDVIDALGGNTPVAELIGVTPAAVSNWRKSEKFPPYTFLVLTKELEKHDATAPETLWSFTPTAKTSSREARAQ